MVAMVCGGQLQPAFYRGGKGDSKGLILPLPKDMPTVEIIKSSKLQKEYIIT